MVLKGLINFILKLRKFYFKQSGAGSKTIDDHQKLKSILFISIPFHMSNSFEFLIFIKDIPLRFTIKELIETPSTGEVAHCVLELDGKQTIEFTFGLNADTPQDITNSLVTSSLSSHIPIILSFIRIFLCQKMKETHIESSTFLTEIIQNVIQYINANKHNLSVIQNKQFTAVLAVSNVKKAILY